MRRSFDAAAKQSRRCERATEAFLAPFCTARQNPATSAPLVREESRALIIRAGKSARITELYLLVVAATEILKVI